MVTLLGRQRRHAWAAGLPATRLAQEWGDGFSWGLIAGTGISLAILLLFYMIYIV